MSIFKQDSFTLIDVSHTVKDGMITYKGLPAPIICDYLTREASRERYGQDTSFQIGVVTLCSNTGTYVDVPFHRFEDGKDLSETSLDLLANLDAVKVEIGSDVRLIEPSLFEGYDLEKKAILIQTGWDKHWGTDQYFENHPFLTADAAHYLRKAGVVLVGIDSYNIDDTNDDTRPAHTILLGADIPICEHMTGLEALPECDFRFFAVPVKIEGVGTFPVRAFGLLEESSQDA